MPRPLKQGILGKYAFMCGSNFYETDIRFEFIILGEIQVWVDVFFNKLPKNRRICENEQPKIRYKTQFNILCAEKRWLLIIAINKQDFSIIQ